MTKVLSAVFAAAAFFALSNIAEAKPYKCWNPAICKAVCGSAICGNNFASQAQQQDMAAKPKVKAAPASTPR